LEVEYLMCVTTKKPDTKKTEPKKAEPKKTVAAKAATKPATKIKR